MEKQCQNFTMNRRKNKMAKSEMTVTIKGGYIPTKLEGEELQRFLQERKRGVGSHRSQKDYQRKSKYGKVGY